MTPHVLLAYLPLLGLLTWAAVGDLRARRLPNALTFCLAATGLWQSCLAGHTVSPAASLLGFLMGFALPFLQFALGALGGGDVKLLAGVGAWVGPQPVLIVFLLAAVIGMVLVLVQAWWQQRLGALLRNSAAVAINLVHVRELGIENAKSTGLSCRSVERPLPYAVPVLLAVVLMLCTRRGGY